MRKFNDPVTDDLSEFGRSELITAEKLIHAYLNHNQTKFLANNLKLYFNKKSGYVFLCDEDYNVAMLNEKEELIDYLICSNCGNEGLITDQEVWLLDFDLHDGSHEQYICNKCKDIH